MPNKKLIQKVAERTMRWNFRMWGFGEAIALRGLIRASEVTGDKEMLGYVHALLRAYVGRGVAKSAEEHVAPGRELLLLHEKFGDAAFLHAAKKLAALHEGFSINQKGARMHRCDLPGWREQIWVDCMDSEAPFLAQLGAVTGEKKYFNQAANELLSYARILQNTASGLFYHGYETHCGLNGHLWARGNGWALMGLVESLLHLPKNHSSRKELLRRLHQLCAGLAKTQDDSGLWHTVIPNAETYLESTLATMTAFALREAFSEKLLSEKEFGAMEKRARAAALRCIDKDGGLKLVSDATPIGELKMYATRPFGIFPWGQGPLLLMLTQD
jgi:unsaturated rhamnogalacturonyl hydrolase